MSDRNKFIFHGDGSVTYVEKMQIPMRFKHLISEAFNNYNDGLYNYMILVDTKQALIDNEEYEALSFFRDCEEFFGIDTVPFTVGV